jgi:carboxypeptidase C (cathepsin A)
VLRPLLALLLPCALLAPLHAQDSRPASQPTSQPAEEAEDDEAEDDVSITEHTLTLNGEELHYEVRAGTLLLKDDAQQPKAKVFYVAYRLHGVSDTARRPLTFSFNGGPGSSSVWLHLGALGPKRVVMGDPEGASPRPPYRLTDNEHTWLPFTDLVFVDPVSTGYSRAVEGESPKQFHGLDEDVRWVGEFIRLWTTQQERWSSPKFLAGESYGTTRAAGLARHLQDRHGMDLNGLVLISPVLDFSTLRFNDGNDLPYWLFLPTYTATAHYHGQLAPELQADLGKALAEVEDWARSDYLLALAQGADLPAEDYEAVATRLARYTGLSVDFVKRCDLRITIWQFTKELLRDQDRTVGRLDSRYRGIDRDSAGDSYEFDPSYAAIQGPYTACLNAYVRGPLAYESDLPYEILTGKVHPWSYASAKNRYVNVAEGLRQAMSKNRHLRVLSASGYYDLATPHFAMDYTVDHLGLDPSLRGNMTQTYYQAGHMMYLRLADLAKLTRDVRAFYRSATAD